MVEENNCIIITGSQGYLGSAIVSRLVSEGIKVIGLDIVDNGNRYTGKGSYSHFTVDITNRAAIEKVLGDIKQLGLNVYGLVNNAAITSKMHPKGTSLNEKCDAMRSCFEVDVIAPFTLISLLLETKTNDNKPLAVVNIGSIYGCRSPKSNIYLDSDIHNPPSYAVSKAGLQQLARWFSGMAPGRLRINNIILGGVHDPKLHTDQFTDAYSNHTHLGRMAATDDITGACSFLLGEDSLYITGTDMYVDGGWCS